jgi:ABC-2 type transport system ATP-binding protein
MEVKEGVIHGLIGNNGAGKSTLLKALTGFITIEKGKIECLSPEAEMALVPEDPVLYEYLSPRETLDFVLRIFTPKNVSELDDFIQAYNDFFDFSRFGEEQTHKLSSGNRKKLSILTAIATGKSILLMDEPMRGLDPASRYFLKRLIKQKKSEGKTVLWSSHELDSVEELCDDITLLHLGHVLYSGSVSEFKTLHPGQNLESAFITCTSTLADR